MGNVYFSTHLGPNGGTSLEQHRDLAEFAIVVVPTFRLDQIIQQRVDLMKMDVEGAEGLVVEGGWSTIVKNRPIVVSESLPRCWEECRRFNPWIISRVSPMQDIKSTCSNARKLDEVGSEIQNIGAFFDSYGQNTRIEDFGFIPIIG